MDYSTLNCIDAGSENCPCCLALTGDCFTCSRLQGKDYCDCNWRGVCIYNEFILNGRAVNNPRKEFECRIIKRTDYSDDITVFGVSADKGIVLKCDRPGTYVFVHRKCDSLFYEVPLSIMKADVEKSILYIAVKKISHKTKEICTEKEALMIRGPYRNGIIGLERNIKRKKIFIITKGIGLAPGIMASDFLSRTNDVRMIIDKDKINDEIISDYIGSSPYSTVSLSSEKELEILDKEIKSASPDLVILMTSDYYIKLLRNRIMSQNNCIALAVGNNFKICCGEGICGACSVDIGNGKCVKMCKCG